jgi:DNA-binding winged helix-turn-helix (wHTH) protein
MAILRFGTFELDSVSQELRRQGVRVPLRPQPCAALAYLAARSGRFVARAELHRHLWGDHTHVHFDQGLNSCVKQIRRALGDRRRAPQYLETLPRRGYRFLMPVRIDDEVEPSPTPGIDREVVAVIARTVAREIASALSVTGDSGKA